MTAPAPLVVVAAAIVLRGRVLAGQRSYPPELAGQWELPGGKVAAGETEPVALQRECREELGIDVAVGGRLGADLPTLGVSGTLRVYRCSVVAGEARAVEHQALRWLGVADLDSVAWLATDRPLLTHLRALLQ